MRTGFGRPLRDTEAADADAVPRQGVAWLAERHPAGTVPAAEHVRHSGSPAGPVSLAGISNAEAGKFVTTPVRVLAVVKEEWAPAVAITQRVQSGEAPVHYTLTVTPNRQEVLLEAGRQHVVAVGPGDLTAGPGTNNYGFAFAEVVHPVKRGVAGEVAYWRDVLAKAPPKPTCDDTRPDPTRPDRTGPATPALWSPGWAAPRGPSGNRSDDADGMESRGCVRHPAASARSPIGAATSWRWVSCGGVVPLRPL